MRKIRFENDEYYHIYNRGVDKRPTFYSRKDYERFLYLLWACNDEKPLLNSQFHYRGLASIVKKDREKLADIVCFCLMPNHFHLLLKQKRKSGISQFMQKVSTGYTMYFNTKQGRSGSLFQGPFKAKHIDQEEYLTHLTRYIHLNPAELKESHWGKKGIQNFREIYDFVKQYPWSSLSDYLGKKHFDAFLDFELLSKLYETPEEYDEFMKSWLVTDLNLISNYTIEA